MPCPQKRYVIVTSLGCCYVDGRGAPQSPNRWRSCKVRGRIEEGEIGSDRGMVMEVEGVWNLGGIRILSCIRTVIGTLVFVLVLVVEVAVVLVVVLV